MTNLSVNLDPGVAMARQRELRAVWVFALLTLVFSVGVLFLLPGVGGASIVVFIPTILAAVLIRTTVGKGQVRRRLFSREQWRISLKWVFISLGLALALRVGVSLLGLLIASDYTFESGPFSPALIIVFLFAAGEQIGWRGYALPILLENGFQPLMAALLLGIPWALLHLPLTLPGMLSASMPMVAQFLIIMFMAVLTTWVYLAGGGSLTAAVLLHGGQNMMFFLNNGLDVLTVGWLMAAVYGGFALLVIVLTRGRLGLFSQS